VESLTTSFDEAAITLVVDEPGANADDYSQTAGATDQQTHELIIIDADTPDHQTLVGDIVSNDESRRFEVLLLETDQDGITQISQVLSQYQDLDAVHLISHGTDAALQLGNTTLDQSTLASRGDTIAAWGNAFSEKGDLLIYGCDLAATDDGKDLVDALSRLTDADVAASDDLTGNAPRGGDWDLEYAAGTIESNIAVSVEFQQQYSSVLTVTEDAISTGAVPSETTSGTVSHTTALGDDRLMLVGISFGGNQGNSVSSVTYNGTNLTLVDAQNNGSTSRVEIWSLVAPDTGTHNVVVTVNGTSHKAANIAVMTFTDVNQVTPVGAFSSATGGSTTASTTVTSAVDEVVFGVVASTKSSDVSFTPGSGQTEKWDLFEGIANSSGTIEAGAASVVTSWTMSDAVDWAAAGVSIKPANNAPVLTPETPSLTAVTEDELSSAGDLISSIVGTSITDVDAGAVEGIAITATTNSNGTWEYSQDNGTTWGAVGTVSETSALLLDAADKLRFVPDGLNADSATITYRAWDQYTDTDTDTAGTKVDVSTNGGGTAFSTATDTASITVTAVNDDPSNTGTLPTDITVTEDVSSNVDLSVINLVDVDAGASSLILTLTTSTGGTLSAAAGAGTTIGGSSTALTLTGSLANLNTYLNTASNITYLHGTANLNGNDADTIAVKINDNGNTGAGGGGDVALGTMNVDISAVNDAPTAATNTVTTNEDTAYTFTAADFSFSDIYGDTLDSVKITMLETVGALQLLGVDVTLNQAISKGDIDAGNLKFVPAADANGAGYDSFGFSVNDGSADSASSYTMTVDVTAVNDSPVVNTNTGMTVSEGGTGSVITTAMLNEGDVDDAGTGLTYTVTTGVVNGTLKLSGAAIGLNDTFTQDDIDNNRVTYDHDGSQTNSDSFAFSLADGGEDGATAATGTFTITVTNVNDAPVNTVPGAQSVDEDTALAIGGIAVADADDNLSTVQLSVNNGTLNITLSGAASISAGANGSAALTLSGSLADINATLASLSYQGNADFNGSDTLTVLSTDSNSATDADTVAITVNAVNDAPVGLPTITGTAQEDQTLTADTLGISDADGLGPFSYQWLRDGAVIGGATASTYTLGDADVDAHISVQLSYTDAQGTAEGPLTSAQTAMVTNVNDAPTGSATITGTPTEDQTLTAVNTLADADGIGAVSYQWQQDGVDIAGATSSTYTLGDTDVGATMTVVAGYTDGQGTPESVASAGVGPIANINDAPVITSPASQQLKQDTPLLFSSSSGNAILISDVDDTGAQFRIDLLSYEGTLSLATNQGLTFLAGDGQQDA